MKLPFLLVSAGLYMHLSLVSASPLGAPFEAATASSSDTLVVAVDNYQELADLKDSLLARDDYESLVLAVAENQETWVVWGYGLPGYHPPYWEYEVYLDSLPEYLAQLSHLRNLDLSYTGISQLPDDLRQLSSLEKLDLSFNYIDLDKELPKLLTLPSLRSLALFGYKVTGRHMRMLKEYHSDIEVYHLREQGIEYYQLKEK